ncbi:plasmid fertility inhibition factor family protein [Variovorax sp. LT1P1]|uniref:plasmid fertility inhibition factor family protein n=1 Tax=Variovorax sp. LT1P1 TaxID=3443730 RepID=UPI003F4512F6
MRIESKKYFGTSLTVFHVPIDDSTVSMCAGRSEDPDAPGSVVFVDAERFLEAWRADTGHYLHDVARGDPSTWPSDYKFQGAADGFASHERSPVPLAQWTARHNAVIPVRSRFDPTTIPGPDHEEVRLCVYPIDGVTRTIWLLTHGAKVVPVHCFSPNEAALMADACGVPGLAPVSIAELTAMTASGEISLEMPSRTRRLRP